MKFKRLIGYRDEDSSFIAFEIEDGDNSENIGDQMWISRDGKEMEISDMADTDTYSDTMNLFSNSASRQAFKGAMLRMGVEF